MIVTIVVALLGVLGLVLGVLQLGGRLPATRRGAAATYTAYVNIAIGVFLLALAALRFKGVV